MLQKLLPYQHPTINGITLGRRTAVVRLRALHRGPAFLCALPLRCIQVASRCARSTARAMPFSLD
jgi:hypothetical protein